MLGSLPSRFIPCAIFFFFVAFSVAQTTPETPKPAAKTTSQTAKRKRPAASKTVAHSTAHPATAHPTAAHSAAGRVVPVAYHTAVHPTATVAPKVVTPAPIIRGGPWTEPTYADSTQGDNIDGEDLDVRKAAVEALGDYNGSVVAVDPNTGRVLTMVNQKVALATGFQPCSTVKVSVALAALSEKAVDPVAKIKLPGGPKMDMTYALAHSINLYFATLGEKMGFEKVAYYAHLFGYGEKAGLNIAGEQPGHYPSEIPGTAAWEC